MKIQRNPERMIVNLAVPVALVAKVRTAIAGRTIPAWTRDGFRPSKKCRPMSVSAFFVESVERAVEGITPSAADLSWAEQMIAKGRANHTIATKERWAKRKKRRANFPSNNPLIEQSNNSPLPTRHPTSLPSRSRPCLAELPTPKTPLCKKKLKNFSPPQNSISTNKIKGLVSSGQNFVTQSGENPVDSKSEI